MPMATRVRRPSLTFRLRTLLVLVAVVCALLAWRANQVRSRELALAAMRSADAGIIYENESEKPIAYSLVPWPDMALGTYSGRDIAWSEWRTNECNTHWSRRMLVFVFGDPNQVYGIDLGRHGDEERLDTPTAVAEFDDAVARLPTLAEIKYLNIEGSPASESALNSIGRLKNLERLYLVGTQASDKTLQQIGGLTRLQWLAIGSPNVTANGLEGLRPLHNLLWLELNECTIGDDGVDSLQHLTGLRQLALPTTVSDQAAQRLRESLPVCNIVRGDPRQLNSRGIPLGGIF
jgi:hypothetical protein